MLLYARVVEAIEEANFDKDPPEERKVVVVAKADHSSKCILLTLPRFMLVQIRNVKHLGYRDKGFQDTIWVWMSAWPRQIEGHHFRKVSNILNVNSADDWFRMPCDSWVTIVEATLLQVILLELEGFEELSDNGFVLDVFP